MALNRRYNRTSAVFMVMMSIAILVAIEFTQTCVSDTTDDCDVPHYAEGTYLSRLQNDPDRDGLKLTYDISFRMEDEYGSNQTLTVGLFCAEYSAGENGDLDLLVTVNGTHDVVQETQYGWISENITSREFMNITYEGDVFAYMFEYFFSEDDSYSPVHAYPHELTGSGSLHVWSLLATVEVIRVVSVPDFGHLSLVKAYAEPTETNPASANVAYEQETGIMVTQRVQTPIAGSTALFILDLTLIDANVELPRTTPPDDDNFFDSTTGRITLIVTVLAVIGTTAGVVWMRKRRKIRGGV